MCYGVIFEPRVLAHECNQQVERLCFLLEFYWNGESMGPYPKDTRSMQDTSVYVGAAAPLKYELQCLQRANIRRIEVTLAQTRQ